MCLSIIHFVLFLLHSNNIYFFNTLKFNFLYEVSVKGVEATLYILLKKENCYNPNTMLNKKKA